MMFNYNVCPICKDMKNDVKLTLYHMFPTVVCDNIGDCNVYCSGCSRMRRNEVNFLKYAYTKGYEKIELQIRYFNLYNPSVFHVNDVKKIRVEKMSKIINTNADDDFKKLMISYFIHRYRMFKDSWFLHIGCKKMLRELVEEKTFDIPWSYYNKMCKDRVLVKLILYEYILETIGDDIVFIEIDDIHKYLDDIFND